jgi:uncharacterized membrane protein
MSSSIEPASRPQHISWAKVSLFIAGVMAYQWLAYYMTVNYPRKGLGEALVAAPVILVAAGMLVRTARGRLALAILTTAGIAGFLAWRAAGADPVWFYPVPYLAVYLMLLWTFGSTLVSGRQPLVTQLATLVHGHIPAEIARYTRSVTWAWCGFFAGMTITSALLFLFAPFPVWSVFNSLLNLPLVVAMYLGEYAWRLRRYPHFSHASIATVLRAMSRFEFRRSASGR